MSNINAIIFIILYVLVALIGWEGLFNFDYATPESWYSRSGALLTLIGLYSEIKILPQVSMLADESQNEKYAMISLMITKGLTHTAVIHGTIVWAYGDIYHSWLKEHMMFSFVMFVLWALFFLGWLSKKGFFNK